VASEGADALCLQEHKLQTEKKAAKGGKDGAREIFGGGGGANKLGLPGWHITWACSTKPKHLGLSGVAIASRVRFLSLFFFGLFFSGGGERERGEKKDGKPKK
jgi:exonuclease III